VDAAYRHLDPVPRLEQDGVVQLAVQQAVPA
jgi:hypothetical protein